MPAMPQAGQVYMTGSSRYCVLHPPQRSPTILSMRAPILAQTDVDGCGQVVGALRADQDALAVAQRELDAAVAADVVGARAAAAEADAPAAELADGPVGARAGRRDLVPGEDAPHERREVDLERGVGDGDAQLHAHEQPRQRAEQ